VSTIEGLGFLGCLASLHDGLLHVVRHLVCGLGIGDFFRLSASPADALERAEPLSHRTAALTVVKSPPTDPMDIDRSKSRPSALAPTNLRPPTPWAQTGPTPPPPTPKSRQERPLSLPTRPPCMHPHRGCVRAGLGFRVRGRFLFIHTYIYI